MNRILIYPYNKRYEPILKFQELLLDGNISEIISPPGWGLVGNSINTEFKEYIVKSDFALALDRSDTVWFVEDGLLTLPKQLLQKRLKQAIHKRKKIIYTRYCDLNIYNKMNSIIPKELNVTPRKLAEIEFDGDFGDSCLKQTKPIIFAAGSAQHTDKYAMQLGIIAEMRKKGYHVSAITSRRDSELLGCHSIPDFMWDFTMTSYERILRYNHFVKLIEVQEDPDVIIIGIPGGALPYSKTIHNYFGIMAFEIFNAVECDCGVFCSLFEFYNKQYFREIENLFSEKYNVNINFHHVSNVYLDINAVSKSIKDINFLSLNPEFVRQYLDKIAVNNLYNVYSKNDMEKLVNGIEEQLSDDRSC